MNLTKLLKDERLMKAMIGVSRSEFEVLVPTFDICWQVAMKAKSSATLRQFGGGKKGTLSTVEEKLAGVLLYLKCYPTFDLFGFLIGGERSRACRNIHFLLPILEKTLGRQLVLPERKITSVEEFLKKFPEAKDIFIDGTERTVQKPKNQKKKKKLYSGKKKQTTRKTIVVNDEKKTVLVLTPTKSGRRHDKRLLEKFLEPQHIPENVTVWTDTGFQGAKHLHENTIMPIKATKNKPLTEEQKQNNRIISGLRIISEHTISGIKRLKAAADIYRNRLPNLDDTFTLLSAGLWNLHLQQTT